MMTMSSDYCRTGIPATTAATTGNAALTLTRLAATTKDPGKTGAMNGQNIAEATANTAAARTGGNNMTRTGRNKMTRPVRNNMTRTGRNKMTRPVRNKMTRMIPLRMWLAHGRI